MAEGKKTTAEMAEEIKALLDKADEFRQLTPAPAVNLDYYSGLQTPSGYEPPKYASREDAINNMSVDTVMYLKQSDGADSWGTERSYEEQADWARVHKEIGLDIGSLREKATQLLQDPKVLGLEVRDDTAKKNMNDFQNELENKYKDAPEAGIDESSKMFVNGKFVKIEKSEDEKLNKFSEECFDTSRSFHAAVNEKVDELLPNGNNTQKIFVANALYRSDDFLDKEQGKAAEILKDGQNVPAPKAIDPEILKQGGKAPE